MKLLGPIPDILLVHGEELEGLEKGVVPWIFFGTFCGILITYMLKKL